VFNIVGKLFALLRGGWRALPKASHDIAQRPTRSVGFFAHLWMFYVMCVCMGVLTNEKAIFRREVNSD
jgi:hypothetical protein